MNRSADIIPLHRGSVSHPVDYPIGARFADAPRHVEIAPYARFAMFIEHPFAMGVYVGIYIGCLLTVAAAFLVAF